VFAIESKVSFMNLKYGHMQQKPEKKKKKKKKKN